MERGDVGRHVTTNAGGEQVRVFVPVPLPNSPALVLEGSLQHALEAATLALGRSDAASTLLPDEAFFLYGSVRKEAILSSQIEGTQSLLSDLLRFKLEDAPGVPFEDVVEVSNYVAALEHGLRRLEEGFPLCNRLIREIHEVLLSRGCASGKAFGEFRRSQNWIGGTRPGNATVVPPPHTAVPNCMAALERFLYAGAGLPVLVRAGLAHVQFETIHPFLDGNGRVGRLLITLLLCNAGVLRQPLQYLSLYFKQHRGDYYELLNHVRRTGDWEAWLAFFLESVRATAEGAVATSRRLAELFASDRAAMERSAGSVLGVHDVLKEGPIVSLSEVRVRTTLSLPTAAAAMQLLAELRDRARADRRVPQPAVCIRPVSFHPHRGNRAAVTPGASSGRRLYRDGIHLPVGQAEKRGRAAPAGLGGATPNPLFQGQRASRKMWHWTAAVGGVS